ncbi:hypothetical protein [Demequina sp. NBRC 110057]|uniref:hypothetical protein n=1 Tax=Demequina sp. NBRC 110057 TaxID=1570346 RepID=UPI000A03EB38|nr:hypothetical protein [Demequina sp. NBRC 110057]
MRRLLPALLASALLCAGCTAAGGDADTSQASASSPATAPVAATSSPSGAFWATVAATQGEITAIITGDIGRSFHERVGSQDTAVALSTVAETELGWQLDAPFEVSPEVSEDEATLTATLDDPASIGEDSSEAVRRGAFLRYGSDDARDFARDMCRALTEGTRADLIAAVADASDASRTDPASPAAAGAGLAVVVCPEMTDEYLDALHELATTA